MFLKEINRLRGMIKLSRAELFLRPRRGGPPNPSELLRVALRVRPGALTPLTGFPDAMDEDRRGRHGRRGRPARRLAAFARRAAAALLLALISHMGATAHAQAVPNVTGVGLLSVPAANQNGSYKIGDAVTAVVYLSENVDVTGTPQLEINVGGNQNTLSYNSGSSTAAALVFTGYTVAEGDEDTDGISIDAGSIDLNGGTIKASDNAANANLAHTGAAADAGQKVDGVRPTFVGGSSGDSNFLMTMVWSENMDPDSKPPGTAFSLTVSSGTAPTVVSVFGIGGKAVFLLGSAQADATAHVRLTYTPPTGGGATPFKDLAGNAADAFSGRTLSNVALTLDPPSGVSVTPGPGSLTVSWNAVRGADHYSVYWRPKDDGADKNQRAVVSGGNTTSFTIPNLTPGTVYRVVVTATRTYGVESDNSDVVNPTPLHAAVSSVALTSDPGADGFYVAGDTIKATVTFNGPVDVAGGNPELELDFDGTAKAAACTDGTAVTTIVCSYTVADGDTDTDGVAIGANKLALNGATIKLAGTAHNAVLDHAAVAADAGHKVDTTPPAVVLLVSTYLVFVFESGDQVRIILTEKPSTTMAPPGAFTVLVDSVRRDVTSISVNVQEIALDLATPVAHGETVTVEYADPTAGDDARALQDPAGNDAASFGPVTASNNVPETAVAAPDAPAAPTLTVVDPRTIDVDWEAPADNGVAIDSYVVETSGDGVTWTVLKDGTEADETRDTLYRDTTVDPGSTRHYRISAYYTGTGGSTVKGPVSPPASATTGGGYWFSQWPASVAEGEEIEFTVQNRNSVFVVEMHVSDPGGVVERVHLPGAYTYRDPNAPSHHGGPFPGAPFRVENTYDLDFLRSGSRYSGRGLSGDGELKARIQTRANGRVGEGGSVTLTILERGAEPYQITIPVTDNEPAGLVVEDGEADESDGTMAFKVHLTRQFSGTFTVDYATADLTAREGLDYTQTDGTLTFAANETEKTVSVPILTDNVADDDERFRLVLSNPSGGTKINRGAALGTIRDSSTSSGVIRGIMLVDAASGTDLGLISTSGVELPDPLGKYRFRAVLSPGANIGSVDFTLVAGDVFAQAVDNEAPYELFSGSGHTLTRQLYTLFVIAYAQDDARGTQLASLNIPILLKTIAENRVAAGDVLSGLTIANKTSGGSAQVLDDASVIPRAAGERFEVAAAVMDESLIGSVYLELFGGVYEDQVIAQTHLTQERTPRASVQRTDNEAPYELFGGSGKAIPSGVYTVRALVYGNADRGGSVLQELVRTFTLGELKAEFEEVPAQHYDGEAFTFHVRFNERVGVSDATLKQALAVTGGTITSVKRVGGRADLREVRVQPADDVTDITLSLPATTDCDAAGAVCTHDQRMLSNDSSGTVPAALSVSVSDASATEGNNAVFKVTLNKEPTVEVTVEYETKDGSAVAGTDYTAQDGTLTFAAKTATDDGETEMTVEVPLLTDTVVDDSELFTLVLSNARGGVPGGDQGRGPGL